MTDNSKTIQILSFFPFFLIWGMVIICTSLYPEPYRFFYQFISELGATHTPSGYDNTLCMTIFIVTFIILGTVFLLLAYLFFSSSKYEYSYLIAICCIITSMACFYIAYPHDMLPFDAFHGLGATIFYIGFGLLIILMNGKNGIACIVTFFLVLIIFATISINLEMMCLLQKVYTMLLTTTLIFTTFTQSDKLEMKDDYYVLNEPIF